MAAELKDLSLETEVFGEGLLFVVEALRWGDRENHSYVVGVYSNRDLAEQAGIAEEAWRAGKYNFVINVFKKDYIRQRKLDNLKSCEEDL